MSHYTVAVFADDPRDFDRLLAPYNESDEAYFEFHPVGRNSLIEDYKKDPKDCDFETWLKKAGYCIDENGQTGYMCNPNAKWDWYTLDAREYLYKLKPGETEDARGFHRKNQYIYEDPLCDEEERRAFWQNYVIDGIEQDPPQLWKPEYYIRRYGTFDQYLRRCKSMAPFAFVTPDGQWHAPGTVGWFAVDDTNADSNQAYLDEWDAYITDETTNPYVSFVDCHI